MNRKRFATEAVIVCGAAAVGAMMWFASGPTSLFEDFLKSYYTSGAGVWHGNDGLVPLYQSVHWTNPPVTAWLFAPFGLLQPFDGALLYLAVGLVGAVATVLLFAKLAPNDERRWIPLALFLVNGPLIYSLKLGNSSHFAVLALAGAIVLLGRNKQAPAGVLIGLISMLKYPLLVLIIWMVARRKWKAAVAAITTVALVVLLSLVEFGPDTVRLWYDCCIGPFSRQPVAAFNAQTLHAFVVRLMTGDTWLGSFQTVPVTTALVWVRYFAAALILGALAIAARAPLTRQWDLLTFSIALIVAIISSPIAWNHYHAMLLLPFTLYFIGDLELVGDRFTVRSMAVSAVLCSLPVIYLKWYHGPVASRTVVSATLFGACLLLVVLVRTARQKQLAVIPTTAPVERAA